MEKQEAQTKFREADRLFNDENYERALVLLDELDGEFPDERRVLYPKARCLAKLRRYDEARSLAEHIVREHKYAPAQKLLDHIDQRVQEAAPDDFDHLPSGLESILNTPASFRSVGGPPALPQDGGADWKPLAFWIGLAVGGFVLVILATFTVGRPLIDWIGEIAENQEAINAGEAAAPPFPMGAYGLLSLAAWAYSWVLATFCGYWSLRIVDSLPYDDFGSDMKDVALYAFIGTILSPIIILGWGIFLFLLKRHYELTFGKLVGTVLLFLVFHTMLSLAVSAAFWVSIIGLMA